MGMDGSCSSSASQPHTGTGTQRDGEALLPSPGFISGQEGHLCRTDESLPYCNPPWSYRTLQAPQRPLAANPRFCPGLLKPGPTGAGAGTRPTDCSGPFNTRPGKWLADQQPGEQGNAGEGSTGKQGTWLLLSSFPSALQTANHTRMEPRAGHTPILSSLTGLRAAIQKR